MMTCKHKYITRHLYPKETQIFWGKIKTQASHLAMTRKEKYEERK